MGVAFEIFGLSVKWYGLLIALGVAMALIVCALREKRFSLKPDTSVNLVLAAMPAAIIIARAYYVIFSWDYYAANPAAILRIRDGGLALYGGVLGGMLGAFIYSRAAKIKFLTLADLAAPAIALGQAIGRWGNFFNQEAYGALVSDPKWQFFPNAVFIDEAGAFYQATFFYESASCFLIFLIVLFLEKRFRRAGDGFFTYALLYSLERSVVEGMRSDSLYWGPVRVSQALSAVAAIAIILYFIIRHARKRV